MSKVSAEFARIIREFLDRNGFTFRAAAFRTSISAAYWKDMSDGRVPSEDVIARISAAFDDLDENSLRLAAGYAPRTDRMDAVAAVEFALRGQESLPEEGKQQILDFVRETQMRYAKPSQQ